jgi:hypothetical protein
VKELPSIRVDVTEPGARTRKNWLRCAIGENLRFTTESLESYFFTQWEPVVYDALLVAAAAEFCDRTQHRFSRLWAREISISVPVHDPDHWNRKDVLEALHDVLEYLTGDRWHIEFRARSQPVAPPLQGKFILPGNVKAVIPFSDGLDSRAVAGLWARSLGDTLVRVRLGSKEFDEQARSGTRQPFTAVPYKVQEGGRPFAETTARSRGFKFALISGLAAYLAKAAEVIVPESGQGALGPALVPVGQAGLGMEAAGEILAVVRDQRPVVVFAFDLLGIHRAPFTSFAWKRPAALCHPIPHGGPYHSCVDPPLARPT